MSSEENNYEDEDYGSEEFEEQSPQSIKEKTPFFQSKSNEYSVSENEKNEEENESSPSSIIGKSLENYLKEMKLLESSLEGNDEDNEDNEKKNKQNVPGMGVLDGTDPTVGNVSQSLMKKKLLSLSSSSPSESPDKKIEGKKKKLAPWEKSYEKSDEASELVRRIANQTGTGSGLESVIGLGSGIGSRSGSGSGSARDKNNSERVDALLMELFPERAALFAPHLVNNKNNKKNNKTDNHNNNNDDDDFAEVKSLRKELKKKEEKLQRVTEHSVMLANHLDKVKGESALFAEKLHKKEMELQSMEQRLQEVNRLRKKEKLAKKTAVAKSSDELAEKISDLESANIQLQEREQALLLAVEELSMQNQDLITKLKESMQRELELSSQRAAFTIQEAVKPLQLPLIGNDFQRAQSEPLVLMQYDDKRSSKKKKKA